MSAVWTVAAREIRVRRMLLIASLVVAALPFVARVLGGAHGRDLQELVALLVCTSFPFAVALGVGASLISRELGERRLGFYFSRPIPALHLWAGKFLGGGAMVVAAFALMQVSIFFSVSAISRPGRLAFVLGAGVLLLVFLMAAGNAVTSMYRARDRWFVADVLLGAAFLAAFVTVVRATIEAGAIFALIRHPHGNDETRALEVVLLAVGVALLGGAAAQLCVGRTDARRAHAALSSTVWLSALLILGSFVGWQRWVLGSTPAQAGAAGYPLLASPSGEGLFFRGLSGRAGFLPYYLMDAKSGAFLRLSPDIEPRPVFSSDGRTAAWVSHPEPWEEDKNPKLFVVRFDGGVRLAVRASIQRSARWHSLLALHPDGRTAVVAGDGTAGILDLGTAEVGASIPRPQVMAADVLADGRIRLFHGVSEREGALTVSLWSPTTGTLAEVVRVPRAALLTRLGDIAVAAMGPHEKAILDLAGGTVHRLTSTVPDSVPRALVLADGRLVLSMGGEVRITDAAGQTLAVVPMPDRSHVRAFREPEKGQLAIGVGSTVLSKQGTLLVDPATGVVHREEAGLLPAGPHSGPAPQPRPGSLASRLFMDGEGALVVVEPGGGRRVLLPAGGGA